MSAFRESGNPLLMLRQEQCCARKGPVANFNRKIQYPQLGIV
jgi:hypothetical protein